MPRPLLPALLAACADPWLPEPIDRVCEDVGYAMASVSFACTSAEDDARAVHAAFRERYRCRMGEIHGDVAPDDGLGFRQWANDVPFEVYYTCPAAVGQVPCADYDRYAADGFAELDVWLGVAPACATILERADGERLPVEEP